jgi:hypothetical protein
MPGEGRHWVSAFGTNSPYVGVAPNVSFLGVDPPLDVCPSTVTGEF